MTVKDHSPAFSGHFPFLVLLGHDGGKDGLTATIGDNTIRVDETFCRIIVVFDRMGILDDYLQKAGETV